MPIDPLSETCVTLREARELIPGRPCTASIWRWAMRGVRGVTLDTVCIGHVRYTSHEAIQRFCAAQTARAKQPTPGAPHNTPRPTSRERERQIAAADRALAAHGIR